MPESRSRSRKRKAATAASKGTSQDAEKDALSQSSAHPPGKEERYVPRFGPSSSAAKRVRTAGTGVAFFSCSQPVAPRAPSGSRVRRASDNATPLTTEGTTSSTQAGDSTAADEVTVRANILYRNRTQILFFHDSRLKKPQLKTTVVCLSQQLAGYQCGMITRLMVVKAFLVKIWTHRCRRLKLKQPWGVFLAHSLPSLSLRPLNLNHNYNLLCRLYGLLVLPRLLM